MPAGRKSSAALRRATVLLASGREDRGHAVRPGVGGVGRRHGAASVAPAACGVPWPGCRCRRSPWRRPPGGDRWPGGRRPGAGGAMSVLRQARRRAAHCGPRCRVHGQLRPPAPRPAPAARHSARDGQAVPHEGRWGRGRAADGTGSSAVSARGVTPSSEAGSRWGVESRRRAPEHTRAGGPGTGARSRRLLCRPVESLRNGELTLPGAHPGEAVGVDAGRVPPRWAGYAQARRGTAHLAPCARTDAADRSPRPRRTRSGTMA